jgi:hypothetical protein
MEFSENSLGSSSSISPNAYAHARHPRRAYALRLWKRGSMPQMPDSSCMVFLDGCTLAGSRFGRSLFIHHVARRQGSAELKNRS